MIVGTIISAGKTVMASEYKDRATVEMGKKVNFTSVFKEQWQQTYVAIIEKKNGSIKLWFPLNLPDHIHHPEPDQPDFLTILTI